MSERGSKNGTQLSYAKRGDSAGLVQLPEEKREKTP